MADKFFIQPKLDHVLVADQHRETTIDGIILPDNVRAQEMTFGLIIEKGVTVTPDTEIGDIVVYGPYAGKTIAIDGVEFRLLREGQIEGTLRKRKPNLNIEPSPMG